MESSAPPLSRIPDDQETIAEQRPARPGTAVCLQGVIGALPNEAGSRCSSSRVDEASLQPRRTASARGITAPAPPVAAPPAHAPPPPEGRGAMPPPPSPAASTPRRGNPQKSSAALRRLATPRRRLYFQRYPESGAFPIMAESRHSKVFIIGSGAAGLTAALTLAAAGRRVLVLAKGPLTGGSTNWAQGGIAAVLEEGDTFEAHVNDTMIAGAGLNDRRVVEHVVSRAPAARRGPRSGGPRAHPGAADPRSRPWWLRCRNPPGQPLASRPEPQAGIPPPAPRSSSAAGCGG